MNDTTFLLDESLQKLAEIHVIQTEMERAETWASQPQVRKKSCMLISLSATAQAERNLGLFVF
jgi:ubiquitin conjugation factor E4 B